MNVIKGKSVFGGVALGKISVYKKNEEQIERRHVEDSDAEIKRFEEAKQTAISQ